ncbi:MAG: transcription-repair coupling factor [Bacteroidales bacterium]|nr:transcription-repair coupling factor [Bacteroidales bacterium]
MKASEIASLFLQDFRNQTLSGALTSGEARRFHLKGLLGSSKAFTTAVQFRLAPAVHLILLPDKERAAYFLNDLEQLFEEKDNKAEEKKVMFFPSSYKRGYATGVMDNQGLLLRTEVMNRLHQGEKQFLVVSYPEAIAEKVADKKFFEKHTLKLKRGEAVSLDFVLDLLIEYEFERTDFVLEPGQFSLRGGLIDVYSFGGDHPYRIEFIGDQAASIRSFDPATQLSVNTHKEITIVPDIRIDPGKQIDYTSIFSFFSTHSVIWAEELGSIADDIDQSAVNDLFLGRSGFLQEIQAFPVIEFGHQPLFTPDLTLLFHTSPQPSFNKNFDLLIAQLRKHSEEGYRNIILSDSPKQSERLLSILEDVQAKQPDQAPIEFSSLCYSIHEGFIDHDLKATFFTDHQIFERYHRFRLRDGYATKEAMTLKELYGLKPGDYVTHIDHGIGLFDGLEKIVNDGKEQEAIRLIYKNQDILYVSIHSLHRISKYSGKEGAIPTLNRLGSDSWKKLKARTKKRVKDIAKDLIRLYAERKAIEGFACTPDTYLQTELEASFIYEDTPDQIKSTADVKRDMEAGFPMDRLICGDVGFGKTEIAIRAAFKMVAESKQVAILVPTTILALQHFKTFSDRLKDFPCNVSYINRFKSAKAQKKIIEELKSGTLDIVIGTHRLLSKDIEFKDLGLLIIDEEQKFGVASKEKIKQFRVNVDTLTLTATPIPRTLQFSLMGARDLSIINTAPPNRFPIQTEIHPFNEEVIREAIQYEISRGGQVFFVNTRVQNIQEIAGLIRRLVPDSSVAVAHGQMEGARLERVMLDFIEGDYDVLVATTIIESGLDIPNVNTIIINDAHHYGLSDLHQLRGRVGRSNKKAFCYLLAPAISTLTDEARKRLRAIEEFSDLGSGFTIAMRDLDIRGAGNILGAEQSGFITEIGFDMYQKILNEAIMELKEQEFKDLYQVDQPEELVRDCVIETDLEILIPDHYITHITERLNLYKELDSIETEEELMQFRTRMADRFGPLPPQTEELIQTIRLRWLAKRIGFERLVLRKERLAAFFPSDPESGFYRSEQFSALIEFIKTHPACGMMKQERNRLSMVFREVNGIAAALSKLSVFSS